jgi:spore coat polysaccharide biosynthesis protein SpsF
MTAGVLLQARLASRRLPRKALLPLGEGNVLQHVLRALADIPAEVHALLTDESSADVFAPFAVEQGFALFVGPEEDVLSRYAQAVRRFRLGRVVRATGDNPLVSVRAAVALLQAHEAAGFDLSHYPQLPLGTGVEVVEAPALLEADARARDAYEREHVTAYLYRNPQSFRVGEPSCRPEWALPEARVTVDTIEDYARIKRIYAELYRGGPVEIEELVSWLRRDRSGERKT